MVLSQHWLRTAYLQQLPKRTDTQQALDSALTELLSSVLRPASTLKRHSTLSGEISRARLKLCQPYLDK